MPKGSRCLFPLRNAEQAAPISVDLFQRCLRLAEIARIEDDVARRFERQSLALRNLHRGEPDHLAHERHLLRRSAAQLREDSLAAVFRLLKRVDDLRLARAAVRLTPRSFLVGNAARLHLDGEDAVVRVQHDEIRLPLRRRADAIAQPAVGVKHRIIIAEHRKGMIGLLLSLAAMKISRKCGIESCHRSRPSFPNLCHFPRSSQ